MKKPGKLVVLFLLFAGACFLLKESVEVIRLRQVNEVLLVEQIEEKHRIMEAYKVLASERQRLIHWHEEDVAKLVEKEFILQAIASQNKGMDHGRPFRSRWVNEVLLVEQIEEKHRIMAQAYKVLASERQRLIHRHEEDVAKLVEKEFISQAIASQKKDVAKIVEKKVKVICEEPQLQATGSPIKERWTEAAADPDPIARERRDKVRSAAIHAWSSYEKYAWGFDAFRPLSREGADKFGGLGGTIIESLDTLYIMGLHDEFGKATEWVSTDLDFNKSRSVDVFQMSSYFLGGLISAYDLSGNPLFIKKAQELADRLLPAWNTATGIPMSTINLASGRPSDSQWTLGASILGDLGGEQVEMIALSQRTGVPKYGETAEEVVLKLREIFPSDGLLPTHINSHDICDKPRTQKITMGVMGGSFYEYLLKVWVLGNKTDVVQHYRDMWEQSVEGLISLMRLSNPSSYMYLAERYDNVRSNHHFENKMDSMACFVPGMLALGADDASPENARLYLEIADGLAKTCYNFYMSTRTNLAGASYYFMDGQDMVLSQGDNQWRPETVESLFYLWRKTGDVKYREWGWDIFQAFEGHPRISTGYTGLLNVNSGEKLDMCPSYFLAETLKYFYLLFSPSSVIPLDEWVFNTGGHPVRIVTRHQDERQNGSQDNLRGPSIPRMQSTAWRDLSGETETSTEFVCREVNLDGSHDIMVHESPVEGNTHGFEFP